MIAEHGLAGFSMDEVGKRAGVAKRTLYNAYQTKERMIAIAIHEYFERFLTHLPYLGPVGSLQRNVERMVFVIQRNRQLRHYISALMSIYFSADADSDIWTAMHSMAVESNLQWINALGAKRQLQPWIEPNKLADDIARCEYAIINDWRRGEIDDESVVYHLVRACLTIAAGAARGAARKEIEDLLAKFHATGIPLPELPGRAKAGRQG
jgi:AcrR family transcriptional regulator